MFKTVGENFQLTFRWTVFIFSKTCSFSNRI